MRRLLSGGTLRGFQVKMLDKLLIILNKNILDNKSREDSRLTGRLLRREEFRSNRESSRFSKGFKILLDRNILKNFSRLIMLNQLKEKCLQGYPNINNSFSFY